MTVSTTHTTSSSGNTTTNSASKRRRSRASQPLGEGESSREASAESNDETGQSGMDEDDTASLSAATGGNQKPSLATRESFEASQAPAPPARATRRTNGPSGTTSSSTNQQGGETGAALTARSRLNDQIDAGASSEGSAGHDGDISSANASKSARPAGGAHFYRAPIVSQLHQSTHSASTDSQPPSPPGDGSPRPVQPSRHPGHAGSSEPPAWAAAPQGFLSSMSAEDIQDHIRAAIAGQDGRAYSIKPPPQDRPVRIYADGVYDLLHYGHMLQLRQCKLAFPNVHLLVGVCSDELVRKYKASPVLSSQERYESVRHCKWVDEVVEDAPWVIDQEFMNQHEIDYVAHDEEPYISADSDDVYAFAKSIGAFLPTRRTNGVSTSELLQRIVEGYREGDYDGKLRKIGHPELCSRQGSEAGTGGAGGSLHAEPLSHSQSRDDITMGTVPEEATAATGESAQNGSPALAV